MTWMIPFPASMSVLTTLAPSTLTPPFTTDTANAFPFTVGALDRPTTSDAGTRPGTTW